MSVEQGDTRTQLNGIDDGYGNGPPPGSEYGRERAPNLELHGEQLTPIAEDAYQLRLGLAVAPTGATATSYSAATDLTSGGLSTGAALRRVTERYVEKAFDLARDCHRIEQHLGYTVTSHLVLEQDIAARMQGIGADMGSDLARTLNQGLPGSAIPEVTPIAGIDY
ncbi:hypothetical protein N0X72_22905 [Streptomyces carpaticus]|uniref:hypothetical protein n=1 Tax=Streptomyces carpaticus TaxID=285558 RepID=UPI00220515C5|nr:hypothetical protein N0X72_22905 [Streptomyces carpaticus]